MPRHRQNTKTARLLLCSAMAALLVTGCAASSRLAHSGQAVKVVPLSDSAQDKAVASAEQAVLANPQDAAARAGLGQAYLAAGRFASAATTFNDAMQLGDNSPRTALSMALAEVGAGNNPMAVRILDKWRDSIPAGDLGLALALAGEPTRGVEILSDALRGGENTPKLRQNLAYAYALDGRWTEAKLMAAQDVPADQLDARIATWAAQGQPDDFGRRIAGLLGAPVRQDPGQPEALALNRVAPATAPVAEFAASDTELPPVAAAGTDVAVTEAQPAAPAETFADAAPALPADAGHRFSASASAPAVVSAPVAETSAAMVPSAPESFASAFTAPATVSPRRSVAPRVAGDYAPRAAGRVATASMVTPRGTTKLAATDCTHLVQLGSFSSETNAKRAWKIFLSKNPELRDHQPTITTAVVGGRKFWRVAASGFNRGGAAGLCTTVKGRGGACIAYAVNRPLPGALPARGGSAAMMARR